MSRPINVDWQDRIQKNGLVSGQGVTPCLSNSYHHSHQNKVCRIYHLEIMKIHIIIYSTKNLILDLMEKCIIYLFYKRNNFRYILWLCTIT